PFCELRANFSSDGERTLLRDVHLQYENGQLNAEILDAPNDFRLDFDSTINPGALRALVSPELRQFLSEWEWQRPPKVHLEIRGPGRDAKTWEGKGDIALDRTRFRGVWMNNASAKVHFKDGAVTYDDLHVTRDEGSGSGSFTYDFN